MIRQFKWSSVDIIREYSRDLAHALQTLHERGIVHGDIKMINAACFNNKIQSTGSACRFDPDDNNINDEEDNDNNVNAADYFVQHWCRPQEIFETLTTAAQYEVYLLYWKDVQDNNPSL